MKKSEENKEKNEQKVRETINFGSVFEALYANFITLEDLKSYLLKKKPENEKEKKKLCVAFRVLCLLSSSHYLENFILQTDNPDYIFLYTMSFHKHNLKVYQKIHSSFLFKADNEFNRAISGSKFDKEESEYIAGTRLLKYVSKYSYGNIFSSDFLSLLKPEDKGKYYRNMIARCMYLNKNAPLYWATVGAPLYRKFLEENYKKPIFSKAETKIIASYFPNLYSEKLLHQPPIVNKLSSMPRYNVAYRLGFPIHEYVPNEKKIEETLDVLCDIGVKQYIENLKSKNKADGLIFANTEDVGCTEISEYNPFDVIHYYTDVDNKNVNNKNERHVFRFTRPEFPTLLKEQKNFYTGEILPGFIIIQIRTRLQIAGMYDLPPCQTLSELLGLKEGESDVDDILEIEDQQLEEEREAEIERRTERRIEMRAPHSQQLHEISENSDEIEEVDEIDLDDIDEDTILFKARNEEGDILLFKLRMDDELYDLDDQELNQFIHDLCLERDLQFIRKFDCRCPECRDEIE